MGKNQATFRRPNASEQLVLEHFELRLLTAPAELERCNDWLARWGHPVALVETFVDPACFRGTTDQGSGWSELGSTAGFGRCAQDFYEPHERPKQLWVRELVKGACQHLRAEPLPTPWAMVEARAALSRPPPVRCTTAVRDIGHLLEDCRSLPALAEFRR
jgi:hypothetical protein